MNWEAINAIAESIGAIGTIIGLVLVYIQLRNLNNSQYATTSQNISSSERELWKMVLDDDSMVTIAANHIGFDQQFLSDMEITAKNAMQLMLFFRQYENIYYQHRNNMLPPNLWIQWKESMKLTFSEEIAWKVLVRSKVGYSEAFREFIQDEIMPEVTALVSKPGSKKASG